jgi:glycerol-3-phosphate dehydrogenase (NAD+)
MWTKDEPIGNDLLSNVINQDHENVKYLPGFLLPKNVHANPDLADVCKESNLLIFALPHQYLQTTLDTMKTYLSSKNLQCVSLIKGELNSHSSLTPPCCH